MFLTIIFMIIGSSLLSSAMALGRGVSPENRRSHTATIQNTAYEARVGKPFFIQLSLDPDTPPPGTYISTLVDMVASPEGAEPVILTGFPRIRLTMMDEGIYRFTVRISLVSKSSCGGIEAQELLKKEIQLKVIGMESRL